MKDIKKIIAPRMNSGFTLLELILASFITTIVVTITGIGLLNLSSSDIRNAAEKELLNNFNRASSFISDELRQAQRVLSESELTPLTIPNSPSNVTKVLGIVNPNFPTRILYFTASPRAQDKLIGPRVLYRYGPDLDTNGTYKTPNDTTTWVTAVVTDLIPDRYSQETDTNVKNALLRTTDTCKTASGWTTIPSISSNSANIDGFLACINGTNRVNFRLYGTFPLAITGTPRIEYTTSTTVFTRSAPSSPSPSPSSSP